MSINAGSLLRPQNSLAIVQGATANLILEVEQPKVQGSVTLQPADLTNAVVYFTVKADPSSSDQVISKSSLVVTEIEIVGNPRDGVARILLGPADTEMLQVGVTYFFDAWVEFTLTGDRFQVIKTSTLTVTDRVTRI